MVELDPKASRAEHESALEKFVTDADPELGAILAPYLRFDQLEDLNDAGRRRIRGEIAQKVREALDPESS
jgi:hypothetical protein